MMRWLRRWVRTLLLPLLREALEPLHRDVNKLRDEWAGTGASVEQAQLPVRHECGHISASSAFSKRTGRTVCLACHAEEVRERKR